MQPFLKLDRQGPYERVLKNSPFVFHEETSGMDRHECEQMVPEFTFLCVNYPFKTVSCADLLLLRRISSPLT